MRSGGTRPARRPGWAPALKRAAGAGAAYGEASSPPPSSGREQIQTALSMFCQDMNKAMNKGVKKVPPRLLGGILKVWPFILPLRKLPSAQIAVGTGAGL